MSEGICVSVKRIRRRRDYCECGNPATVGNGCNAICSDCYRIEQWNKEHGLGWKDLLNENSKQEGNVRYAANRRAKRIAAAKEPERAVPDGVLYVILGFRNYFLPLKYDYGT